MLDQASAGIRPASVIDQARALAARLSAASADADDAAAIVPATWQWIHRHSDLMLAPFSRFHGGADLVGPGHHRDLDAVLRLLGAADLSMARLYEGHVNAVALVRRYGTPDQVDMLAEGIAAGGMSAVWGADDAHGLTARRQGDDWRLDGRKILASGAGFVTHPLVTARTEGGRTEGGRTERGRTEAGQIMILLRLEPGDRADCSGWTAQGMRSTATGTVDLSGLAVGADRIVGTAGDFTRQPHFSGGAWRFCAVHLGAIDRLVELFCAELLAKGRQDDPYQLQRVAHCIAAATTAGFWVGDTARRLAEEEGDAASIVAFANLTRMVTERSALDVLEAVHRGVGLAAFLRPHPIERISRDLSTYLRQPVPDRAMADAARAVLTSPDVAAGLRSRPVEP